MKPIRRHRLFSVERLRLHRLMMGSLLALMFLDISTAICIAQTSSPIPFQTPSASGAQIAFVYAGEIWIVDRNGGREAHVAAVVHPLHVTLRLDVGIEAAAVEDVVVVAVVTVVPILLPPNDDELAWFRNRDRR